jgi:hypothetical protein
LGAIYASSFHIDPALKVAAVGLLPFIRFTPDIILGPQRFLPVITLAFKKEPWRTITRPARAFQLFRLSLPVSRIVGLFQLRHQRFMAARQAEVDAGIFNNVRKADLTNMKIPRWWRIPPIAG